MNPIDEYVTDFQRLFPTATISYDYDEDEVTFFHNADLGSLNESDHCVLEHMGELLAGEGIAHWMIQMDDKNKLKD